MHCANRMGGWARWGSIVPIAWAAGRVGAPLCQAHGRLGALGLHLGLGWVPISRQAADLVRQRAHFNHDAPRTAHARKGTRAAEG